MKILKNGFVALMLAIMTLTFAGCNNDTLTVVVKGQDGAALNGVTVNVGTKSGVTNKDGVATISVPATKKAVVRVSQKGFVNQSVVVTTTSKTPKVQITLQPVKEVISIQNIEQAQTIKGKDLGAQITLPAHAFVKTNGQAAEGNVTLNLTPWDIDGNDLSAMLGNGQALDAQKKRVELISAGMMTIDFYDAAGNHLQLDKNVTAQIQMDLTHTSINNQALSVGSVIPLWHFDENQGLWLEEGTGVVVESATSPVGLAVLANVKHFSTWNWDFKFDNPGSVDVKCELADGNATECNVIADVTLDDGSHFTKSNTLPVGGLHVINMPSSGSITWKGSTTDGLLGTTTSGTTGAVVITMAAPKTKNFVQCMINGVASACTATLENTLSFAIPTAGATINTMLDNSSLSWNGQSGDIIENGKIVYYKGDTVSNTTGAVTLNLNTRVEKGSIAHTILVGCVNGPDTNATSCDISIYDHRENRLGEFTNVPVGSHVAVAIPDGMNPDDNIYIKGSANGLGYGSMNLRYGDLINGQLINIEINQNYA